MQIIAVVNRKGGIGKSTATVSLGGAYAASGLRTLLVDFDPQATLTDSVRLGPAPVTATAAALFGGDGGFVPVADLVYWTAFTGLALVPGSHQLDDWNWSRPEQDGPALFALRDFLVELDGFAGEFDRVLIDCPPNLYSLTRFALAAADWALVPTRADPDGAVSLGFVGAEIARTRAGPNPRLKLLGYLLGSYKKRSALHTGYAALLRAQYPGLVLDGAVPDAAAFPEARAAQTPVGLLKPRSAAAKAVAAIVDEIEARIVRPAAGQERAA